MSRISKLAAAFAALPVMAFASPVLADSPGQLTSGSNTYLVKNLTQNGSYVNSVNTACGDEVQYSIRLHNAAFGGLTNVQVSANLSNGQMTAVPAEGASQGTSGSVTVNLPSGGSLAYQSGSTKLYDANGAVIKTLTDTITSSGVNVGNISGSTTEFVNFKAKVNCPTPPQVSIACTELGVVKIDRTRFDFTVKSSVSNATVTSYVFTAKNSKGEVVDTNTVNTSASSAVYHFNQSEAGTYTVSAVVHTDKGNAGGDNCVKQITVAAETETPTTPTKETTLPNTGAGGVLGIFGGASALGAAGHYVSRRFRRG